MKKSKMNKMMIEEGPKDAGMEDAHDDGSGDQKSSEEHPAHEVESAAMHLMEAEKVKSNESLHSAAKAHLHKKKKAIEKITSIDELKELRNKKMKS